MRKRSLRCQKQSKNVDVELFMEVLRRYLLDGTKVIDAGVVDEYVDGAKSFDGLIDERADCIGFCDVGLNGDGFATRLVDFRNDFLRFGFAARIVRSMISTRPSVVSRRIATGATSSPSPGISRPSRAVTA